MQPMFAFIVLGLAIVAFFSQECIRVCKKITSIPGAKLLLPLAFASWMLEEYEDWGGWLLVKFQAVLHQTIHFFSTLLPFEFERGKISLIRIIFLFLLACLPVWLPVWLHRLKAIDHHLSRGSAALDHSSHHADSLLSLDLKTFSSVLINSVPLILRLYSDRSLH